MEMLGALVLIAGVVYYIMEPILRGQGALMVRDFEETTEAESRRRIALLALRDAEFDYHTGKIDDADYQSLKKRLGAEALKAIRAVDGVDDDQIEAEIRMVREGLRDGSACASCGHRNPPGSSFCAACGSSLTAREPAGSA